MAAPLSLRDKTMLGRRSALGVSAAAFWIGMALCSRAALGQAPPATEQPVMPQPVKATAGEDLQQHLDLVYARYGSREMHLDLLRPKGAKEPLPAVLVVHGGGWLNGDKTRFRAMAQ